MHVWRPTAGVAVAQRGLTLIEVLVTMVVLSIGLLGLAGLQAYALQNNNSAYYASQATILTQDIADRMRANREAALNGQYALRYGDQLVVSSPDPDAPLSERDIATWLSHLRTIFPGVADQRDLGADIRLDGDVISIAIRWLDAHWLADEKVNDTADRYRTFTVSVRP
ncbi:MAG: type IV pilus modification protein PilV [Aquisalimonadaceae bacterium]